MTSNIQPTSKSKIVWSPSDGERPTIIRANTLKRKASDSHDHIIQGKIPNAVIFTKDELIALNSNRYAALNLEMDRCTDEVNCNSSHLLVSISKSGTAEKSSSYVLKSAGSYKYLPVAEHFIYPLEGYQQNHIIQQAVTAKVGKAIADALELPHIITDHNVAQIENNGQYFICATAAPHLGSIKELDLADHQEFPLLPSLRFLANNISTRKNAFNDLRKRRKEASSKIGALGEHPQRITALIELLRLEETFGQFAIIQGAKPEFKILDLDGGLNHRPPYGDYKSKGDSPDNTKDSLVARPYFDEKGRQDMIPLLWKAQHIDFYETIKGNGFTDEYSKQLSANYKHSIEALFLHCLYPKSNTTTGNTGNLTFPMPNNYQDRIDVYNDMIEQENAKLKPNKEYIKMIEKHKSRITQKT